MIEVCLYWAVTEWFEENGLDLFLFLGFNLILVGTSIGFVDNVVLEYNNSSLLVYERSENSCSRLTKTLIPINGRAGASVSVRKDMLYLAEVIYKTPSSLKNLKSFAEKERDITFLSWAFTILGIINAIMKIKRFIYLFLFDYHSPCLHHLPIGDEAVEVHSIGYCGNIQLDGLLAAD